MRLNPKRQYAHITPAIGDLVLEYFYTYSDNRTTVIAKALNLKLFTVDYILDVHLSNKKNSYVSENYCL